jgi:hypothetical protein
MENLSISIYIVILCGINAVNFDIFILSNISPLRNVFVRRVKFIQILLPHEETFPVCTAELHFQFSFPLEAMLNILSPIPKPFVQVWDQKRLWCALKGEFVIGYVKIRNCLLLVYQPLRTFLLISHFTIVGYNYNILLGVSCIGPSGNTDGRVDVCTLIWHCLMHPT